SKEPFVADYARRAVARIEGKPVEPLAHAEAVRKDLWLLPANCAAVGQFAPRPGLAQRFDQAIEPMHIRPEQKKDRLRLLTEYVLELADQIGNVRIDGVTVGASDDFSFTGGFVVAIVRGQFDRAAVAEAYRQFPIASGFDRALLVGRQTGAIFRLEGSAEGNDPKQLDISVHELQRYLKGALDGLHNIAPVMPPLQRVMRFLESIKPNVEGTKLTATATFEGPVTRLIVFMNFPYATAKPVEEGKPIPPTLKPEEAPADRERFR